MELISLKQARVKGFATPTLKPLLLVGVVFLALLFTFGCTETIPGVPYTVSQFVGKTTDLNYSLFMSGYYDGNCLKLDGNKITVADCNGGGVADVNWSDIKGFPLSCPTGQAIQILNDDLTCISVGGSDTNCAVNGSCPNIVYGSNLDANRFITIPQADANYPSFGSVYGWIDGNKTTDTNWQTNWATFDTNLKTQYGLNPAAGRVPFSDGTKFSSDVNLYWDNTGKRLGVGTESPLAKLHVKGGGSGTMRIEGTSTEAAIRYVNASGDFWYAGLGAAASTNSWGIWQGGYGGVLNIISGGSMGIGYYNPGTAKLAINGSVGIGTTNSTYELDINGSGAVDLMIQSIDNRADLLLKGGQTGDVTWVLMSGYPNAGDFTIRESGVANYLTIKKTDGNAGIGTTTPRNKLNVAGDINATGKLISDSNLLCAEKVCYNIPDLNAGGGGSGANTALSNLAAVAINTSLISDTNNTDDLGSSSVKWRNGYFGTRLTIGDYYFSSSKADASYCTYIIGGDGIVGSTGGQSFRTESGDGLSAEDASDCGTGGTYFQIAGNGGSKTVNNYNATERVAGKGGEFSITAGTGGDAVSNVDDQKVKGGSGGTSAFTAGAGGDATSNTGAGEGRGGFGGDFTFTAGEGGTGEGAKYALGGYGGDISLTAGNAGSGTSLIDSSNGIGGLGGAITLTSGTGGAGSSTTGVTDTAIGYASGDFALIIGNGGSASTAETCTAGAGGSFTLTGGNGGQASGGESSTGGAGSSITLTAGAGGNSYSFGVTGPATGGNGGDIELIGNAGGQGWGDIASIGVGGNGSNIKLTPGALGDGDTPGTDGDILFYDAYSNEMLKILGDGTGIDVTGKLNINGGSDPDYLLLNKLTQTQFINRLQFEVPVPKMNGLALWWDGNKLYGFASMDGKTGDLYKIGMEKISSITLSTKNVTTEKTYWFDKMTGEVHESSWNNPERYSLKKGYVFDTATGEFKKIVITEVVVTPERVEGDKTIPAITKKITSYVPAAKEEAITLVGAN